MQPRPPADLTNRQPLDAVHPPDLRPLLHADHTLLLARSFRSSESPDPAGRTDPAPRGPLFDRRRWTTIHPAPTHIEPREQVRLIATKPTTTILIGHNAPPSRRSSVPAINPGDRRPAVRRAAGGNAPGGQVLSLTPLSAIRTQTGGGAMSQRKFRTNVLVCYEPDEAAWVKATLPGMPSVVTAGVSREDAREMAIDALMQLLAAEPERQAGGDYERVRLDVSTGRCVQREPGRGRPKSPPRPAPESG